ncbi:hypothetical protein BCR41DRAFT_319943 [Lobosporangium transversale]|uniref:EF-hand domain-containing protein n=1 Tax=Lobosporangium transversale TaxID=64571 RepID=A0A1Y2GUI0_9FUNG|nr:hypothetical protein BCR41DRAFT_319943 [Lobosporangium transversale]ORZ23886.1 hypothetical protein BCR41DRAFT_319943 [Lobosporangium transversale]|eukprot:XP_021883700.1 hypothetical protein BCR41DRAFT_319943 [Lobosporangium transversale]
MPLVTPPTLVDEDGALTQECEDALVAIFKKYDSDKDGALSNKELDAFAKDTNGDVFDEDTRTEIKEFLDLDDKGQLTLKGFLQMYNLQTSSEPQETWKDLQKHGYDTKLKLVASRREDNEEKIKPTQNSIATPLKN